MINIQKISSVFSSAIHEENASKIVVKENRIKYEGEGRYRLRNNFGLYKIESFLLYQNNLKQKSVDICRV